MRLSWAASLKLAYLLAAVTAIGWVVLEAPASYWTGLVNAKGALAFALGWLLMACSLGALWALQLRWRFGLALKTREWMLLQAHAWIGRYLPGKVGLFAGKLALVQDGKLGVRQLGYSVLMEQIAFVGAGAVLVFLLLGDLENTGLEWIPTWLLQAWPVIRPAGVALTILGFLLALRWFDRALLREPGHFKLARILFLFGLYLIPHLLAGLGLHFFVEGVVGVPLPFGPAYSIAVAALASVLGILAVFAPAGIGVREIVIAGGYGAVMGFPEALAFAALVRFVSVLTDVGLVAVATGMSLLERLIAARER